MSKGAPHLHSRLIIASLLLLAGSNSRFSHAAPRAQTSPLADKLEQRRVTEELASGDSQRVDAAMKEVLDSALSGGQRPDDLLLLVNSGHYAEVEDACVKGILANPFNGGHVAGFESVRTKNFLKQGKPTEALPHAKAYYNCCAMVTTHHAIDLLEQCLSAAHPEDPGIAERFRQQQEAGATTQPSSTASANSPQAGSGQAFTQPTADDQNLGAPILPTIKIDPAPWQQAVDAHNGTSYHQLVCKGNLLLISDRVKEAREAFEQAQAIASPSNLSRSIENIARAIRAENGCVGPANAYILSLQNSSPQ